MSSRSTASGAVSGAVNTRQLQNAVFLVLALYASIALLDPGAAVAALLECWRDFVEFIGQGLL